MRLTQIVHRRNTIVHEGALRRLLRPREITHEPLDRAEVDKHLAWLEQLIAAIDRAVVN